MKSLYLLINFFTIFIPFIYSFHKKIQFHKTWKAFFLASSLVAIVFVTWDAIFTKLGIWNFNPDYVTGIYLFKLPIEEILFFICIPFSCVFTFFCLDKFYNLAWKPKTEKIFCLIFSILLIIVALYNLNKLYTLITALSTSIVCLYLVFVEKINWFGKVVTVYTILLIPFCIVNGVLTGTGIEDAIVRYNDMENLNIRILTIPIEDAFYGFELILLNIFFYKMFLPKSRTEQSHLKNEHNTIAKTQT